MNELTKHSGNELNTSCTSRIFRRRRFHYCFCFSRINSCGVWSSISGRLVLSALWFYLARSVSVPPSDATAPAGPVSTFASPSPPLLKFPVPALDIVLFTTKLTLYHDDHEDQNMDFLQKWGFNSVE